MHSFFRELQRITVFLLICDSYVSRITRFVSLKVCVKFCNLDSNLFLLELIFFLNKKHGLSDFKTS